MNEQHTPGPWLHKRIEQSRSATSPFHYTISRNGFGWWLALITPGQDRTIGESEANARLIAAAPELLESVKALRLALNPCMVELGDEKFPLRLKLLKLQVAAEQAIVKATGKQL